MKASAFGPVRAVRDKARNQRGSIIIFAVATLFILVPLGLISYEAVMARQQYNQLKAATDASALGAATYLKDALDSDEATAEEVGLTYFRKNQLITGSLKEAVLSPTAFTDNPPAGESHFNLLLENGVVVTESSFGLRPFFLSYLGTYTIRARSTAGTPNRLTGDVVLVLDLSASMSFSTRRIPKTARFTRTYHRRTDFVDYRVTGPPGGRRPAKGADESQRTIPNPSLVAYYPPGENAPVQPPEPASVPQLAIDGHTPKMQIAIDRFNKLQDPKPIKPGTQRSVTADDIKLALLIEAKKGNLESRAKFLDKKANLTDLKFVPNLENLIATPGFQLEYQRIALTTEDALHTAKKAIHFFLDAKQSPDIHWSFVGFGKKAGEEVDLEIGAKGTTLDPAKPGDFRYPIVPLTQTKNQSDGGLQAVKDALDLSTISVGTNTPAGMAEAITQLTGPGHTDGFDRTMVVLTDGLPTRGGSANKVKEALRKNIKVIFIGYFLGGYAIPGGPRFCRRMKKKGAQVFYIPDEADPDQRIRGLRPQNLTSGELDTATLAAVEEVVRKFLDKITSGTGVFLR